MKIACALSGGPATVVAQTWPDKLLELFDAQVRWDFLPRLTFGHFDLQSVGILADSCRAGRARARRAFHPMPLAGKTRDQLRARGKFSSIHIQHACWAMLEAAVYPIVLLGKAQNLLFEESVHRAGILHFIARGILSQRFKYCQLVSTETGADFSDKRYDSRTTQLR